MRGKSSPWGTIQDAKEVIPGLWVVYTGGHGGIKLDRKLNAAVPAEVRRRGGWYEEDCEWSLAVFSLRHLLNAGWVDQAEKTAKQWYPDEYTVLTGVLVTEEESFIVQQRAFLEKALGRYVATAAWGDWEPSVPKGMVGVYATVSGTREGELARTGKYFLTTKERYDARCSNLYLVQPDDAEWLGPHN